METISQKMREQRLALGLSSEEVAKLCNVSRQTVHRWENGDIKNMRRDRLEGLSKALRMPIEELLGLEVKKAYQEPEVNESKKEPELEQISMSPQQQVLFDASEDLTPSEMEAVLAMINALKSNRGYGHERDSLLQP